MVTLFSFKADILDKIPAEVYASVFVCVVIAILCIVIYVKSKKVDPLAKPKGIMHLAEIAVEKCDKLVENTMGKIFVEKISPYIGFCCAYIFLCFIISLFGFASPMTYLIVPLSLGLGTFLLIHIVSIHFTKWQYFKRYITPFPIFLPINLISMWAPLISLSFRMFGNACAGLVLMQLLYGVFQMISEAIFGGVHLPLAASVAPFLHLYFDIFSGFIQTIIFVFITMLQVAGEAPDNIDVNLLESENLIIKEEKI